MVHRSAMFLLPHAHSGHIALMFRRDVQRVVTSWFAFLQSESTQQPSILCILACLYCMSEKSSNVRMIYNLWYGSSKG